MDIDNMMRGHHHQQQQRHMRCLCYVMAVRHVVLGDGSTACISVDTARLQYTATVPCIPIDLHSTSYSYVHPSLHDVSFYTAQLLC